MPLTQIVHPLAVLEDWTDSAGRWSAREGRADLLSGSGPARFCSPPFESDRERLLCLEVRAKAGGGGKLVAELRRDRDGALVARRRLLAEGEIRAVLSFEPDLGRSYRLWLTLDASTLHDLEIRVLENSGELASPTESETALPRWGLFRRKLHSACRRSRLLNAAVAAVEMRCRREEVISLPQNLGVCPTGQCNALCEFCSVTVHRTGIVKRQAPLARLQSMLAPSAAARRMLGIEGNGEPSLYAEFDELVEAATRNGANAYLITNGSRLREEQLPLLLRLDSINFSLNAATAETHRRVMALREFDHIVGIIRALLAARGDHARPLVSTSFVVDADNVAEVAEFVRFAEVELGVDRVQVRPLSELAGDLGPSEDLRRIVPFEDDLAVALDETSRYLASGPRLCEVQLDPKAFRSQRPRPRETGVGSMPEPRRWERCAEGLDFDWVDDREVRLSWQGAPQHYLLRSYAISCSPGIAAAVSARVDVSKGRVGVGILDEQSENFLAVAEFGTGVHEAQLRFETGTNRAFRIVLLSASTDSLEARVGWGDPGVSGAETSIRPPDFRAGRSAASSIDTSRNGSPGRFVCQKPWTDLANFSVDGRVDVCCIATGTSHSRYALGNLGGDSFQEIWNGEVMREFRRTVNGPESARLPVCASCPMHYAYDGVFFDPEGTVQSLQRRLGLLDSTGDPAPGLRGRLAAGLAAVVEAVGFRGFKR